MCVIRLLTQLKTGVFLFEDAIPAPRAGCKTNNGAAIVTIPIKSAGSKDGESAQRVPKAESKRAAKLMPIA